MNVLFWPKTNIVEHVWPKMKISSSSKRMHDNSLLFEDYTDY